MRKSILGQFRDLFGGRQTIKVGVIASQIGPLDYYGKMQIQGLQLGIEFGTQGTWKIAEKTIELLIEESAGDPATGGQKARALIEDQGVDILQGCTSSAVTMVVAGIAKEYQRILMVEPAAADSITGSHFNRYVFRTASNVSQDAEAGGAYAVENLGSTFAYLAPDYIWGRQSSVAWKRVIESRGGTTLMEVLPPPDTTDFKPYLRPILDKGPDVLVQSWAGVGYAALFHDLQELGAFDQLKITGGLGDREARHALGMDAAGMIGVIKYSCLLPDNPINDWLRQRHLDKFGEDPDLFTGGGFAAGLALVEGLKHTDGNPEAEALIPVLEGMRFQGPKGTYYFRNEDHQALQPMYIVQMVPDPNPDNLWAIPALIKETSPEETAPPVLVQT